MFAPSSKGHSWQLKTEGGSEYVVRHDLPGDDPSVQG